MEFVTGKAGTNHISGADMAAMYRGLLIADDVVLSEGDKLACTMLDANTAQIGTGSCMLQAHHCRVEIAEQVAIESGSPGFKRNDLIVARYSKGDGNIQAIYLAVIKGTAVAGAPSDPAVTTGSIDGGDVLVEFPLWRIPIDGVSVGTPERVMPTVDTLQDQITDGDAALQSQITALGESVSRTTINGYKSFTSSTTIAYTGLSITIPANSIFGFYVKAAYNYNMPKEIALSTNSSAIDSASTYALTTDGSVCSIAGATENSALTLYVWARYNGSGSNYATAYGWYMPKQ